MVMVVEIANDTRSAGPEVDIREEGWRRPRARRRIGVTDCKRWEVKHYE